MASKQQQVFRMCVCPCPRYSTGGDTHILCVACLGEEHARESAGCEHCDTLALRTLRSHLAVLRISASYQGWEARAVVSSTPIEAHTLQLSDSEELDAANHAAK